MRRHLWVVVLALVLLAFVIVVAVGGVLDARRQVRATQQHFSKAIYAEMFGERRDSTGAEARIRQHLFDELQPVALADCELQRFGEPADGGYVLCANLLGGVQAGYSYGISGYDGWGCDISTKLRVPVHQYDCFDLRQPNCPSGRTIFHRECVGASARVEQGRRFDSVKNQLAANGDAARHVVLKMDVEGAEWDSLLQAPDEVLQRIDQMSVEFHGVRDEKFVWTIERLKEVFWVANLHFNNYSCLDGIDPFPAWAYEVLFVNKRLTTAPARTAAKLHAPDAANNPRYPDCQGRAR